jgi:phosphatidate cytidylyltransferase
VLGRRLISAAVIISVMLLILRFDWWLGLDSILGRPGLLLGLLAIMVAAAASDELAAMFANAASSVNRGLLMMATVAMVTVTVAPALWRDYPADCILGRFGFAISGLVVGVVIVFLGEMFGYAADQMAKGQTIDRLGRSVFVLVYLSTLFAFLIAHRYLGGNGYGLITIVAMITTVKMSDAAAYFAGKSFGTVKLAPALSPGKTVQGAVGGLIGGCAGAALIVCLISPFLLGVDLGKPWWWVFVYGVLVTLAGMFGDLAESLLKRDSDTKDSSSWLPGLGGILDVVDSLIFAAPVSFLLWI